MSIMGSTIWLSIVAVNNKFIEESTHKLFVLVRFVSTLSCPFVKDQLQGSKSGVDHACCPILVFF